MMKIHHLPPNPTSSAVIHELPLGHGQSSVLSMEEFYVNARNKLIAIKLCAEEFQVRALRTFKAELSQDLDFLPLSEERKSYFLHQICSSHEINELLSLIEVLAPIPPDKNLL